MSLHSLRENIAVVFQDPGLMYRSIADNLRIGDPDATQAEMEEAARAAEAHDFIVVKPEGYATLVSERGRSLSGGERQRLAIARAMLKDAPILILDEATSALDNATEARIQRALTTAMKGRTTFVIAHRLTTVRNADLILVLKDGAIVEQGRFERPRRTAAACSANWRSKARSWPMRATTASKKKMPPSPTDCPERGIRASLRDAAMSAPSAWRHLMKAIVLLFAVVSMPGSRARGRVRRRRSSRVRFLDRRLGRHQAANNNHTHNVITREYDGCVIHERYTGPQGYTGESLNAFDATRKVWHQTWVDSQGTLLHARRRRCTTATWFCEGRTDRQGRPRRETAHHLDAERRRHRAPALGIGQPGRKLEDGPSTGCIAKNRPRSREC